MVDETCRCLLAQMQNGAGIQTAQAICKAKAAEAYVHRIGRTGRAGRTGEAVLFVTPRERRFIRNLERATGQPIEAMEVPGNTAINQGRLDRLRKRLSEAAQAADRGSTPHRR